jgi:hypothetical protein
MGYAQIPSEDEELAHKFISAADLRLGLINRGAYEEEPRSTRIRADKDERGERPIRAYPRNPRLDFFGCGRAKFGRAGWFVSFVVLSI